MIVPSVESELRDLLERLDAAQQQDVLEYARLLVRLDDSSAMPRSGWLTVDELTRTMPTISEEFGQVVADTIENECERVDSRAWADHS